MSTSPPTVIDQYIDNIRQRLLATGVMPYRLAVMAGLSPDALRRVRAADWCCSVKTFRRLERLLGRLELDGSAAVVHADNITPNLVDASDDRHTRAPTSDAATSAQQ